MKIKSKAFWKRLLKEAVIFLLFLMLFSVILNHWRAPKLDDTRLPHLSGKTLEGQNVSTLLKKGQPVLIHFWGSWCPICRREASNIDVVAQNYPVLTIAVNSGLDEEVRQWLEKRNLHYPVLNDPYGTLAQRFHITTFPTSLIYDSKGELKFVETGYTTTAGLMARMKLAE
ncbi:protein disulfide oxidoreductase [Nitratifractor salsuginis]|uniref:Redoxin domain protein n=1 Tax=Nitratifractor salsuginis (strain DSM 16511 / JCM 12458 / E9I37-1) TaxID=749222 RepID=E6X345_NITSE|nr:protein disulfide oxidoreductase [Nitratifractor salsuginis]ADV46189.1 Redoxin domain protein [Nitratifractor salsuginis DSM 16511]